ncbi:MAG TPA: hypothetical protein VF989_13455, partial [Polyangiaceae bacterium]
ELEGSWAHAGSGCGGQSQPEVLVLANMRPALIHSRTSVRLLRTFFRIHVFVATACAPDALWFVPTKVLSESAGSGGAKDNFSSMQGVGAAPVRSDPAHDRPGAAEALSDAAAAAPEVVPTAGE